MKTAALIVGLLSIYLVPIFWIIKTRISKNTCNAIRDGQERSIVALHDCIDANIEVQNTRYKELREAMKDGFDKVENRFDKVESQLLSIQEKLRV